jgi:hypothetical protein
MSWKEGLSEENAASPAFKDIGDDINDLAKNFLDAQAFLGNAIRIPSDEASPEDRTAFIDKLSARVPELMLTPDLEDEETINGFLTKMGRPEEDTGYEMPDVNGVELSPERETALRASALKYGLTVKQMKGFMEDMFTMDASGLETAHINQQESVLGLKRQWGVTYDSKLEALKNGMLLTEAPAALTEAIKSDKMPPDVVQWLSKIFGKFTTEGSNLNKDPQLDTDPDLLDPAEASARATEIREKISKGDIPQASKQYNDLLKKLVYFEKMANPDSSSDINDLRTGFTSAKA